MNLESKFTETICREWGQGVQPQSRDSATAARRGTVRNVRPSLPCYMQCLFGGCSTWHNRSDDIHETPFESEWAQDLAAPASADRLSEHGELASGYTFFFDAKLGLGTRLCRCMSGGRSPNGWVAVAHRDQTVQGEGSSLGRCLRTRSKPTNDSSIPSTPFVIPIWSDLTEPQSSARHTLHLPIRTTLASKRSTWDMVLDACSCQTTIAG